MSTNIFSSYSSNSRKTNDICNSNWTFTDGKVIDESMISDFVRNLFTSHDDLHYGRRIEGVTDTDSEPGDATETGGATEPGDATETGGPESYNVVDEEGNNYQSINAGNIRVQSERGRNWVTLTNFTYSGDNLIFVPSAELTLPKLIGSGAGINYHRGDTSCPLSFRIDGQNIIMKIEDPDSCSDVTMPTRVETSVDGPPEVVEDEHIDCNNDTCNADYVRCMLNKMGTLCDFNQPNVCSQRCASTYVDYYDKCSEIPGVSDNLDKTFYDNCQVTLIEQAVSSSICEEDQIECSPDDELRTVLDGSQEIPADLRLCFNQDGSVVAAYTETASSIRSIASCSDDTQPTLTCTPNADDSNTGTYSASGCEETGGEETGTPCTNTPDKTGYRFVEGDPDWSTLMFTNGILTSPINTPINCASDYQNTVEGTPPTVICNSSGDIQLTGCSPTVVADFNCGTDNIYCSHPNPVASDNYTIDSNASGFSEGLCFGTDGTFVDGQNISFIQCNNGTPTLTCTSNNDGTDTGTDTGTYSVDCDQTATLMGGTPPSITQTTFDGIINNIRPAIEDDNLSPGEECTAELIVLNGLSTTIQYSEGTNMSTEDFIMNYCTSAVDPSDGTLKQLDCFIGGIDAEGTGIRSGLVDPTTGERFPISYDPNMCIGRNIENIFNADDTSNPQGGGGTSNPQGGRDTTEITIPDTMQSIYTAMEDIDYSDFTPRMHYHMITQAYNHLPVVSGSSPISLEDISGAPLNYNESVENLALESIKNIESNGNFSADDLDLNIDDITSSDPEALLESVKDSFQSFVNNDSKTVSELETELQGLGLSEEEEEILKIEQKIIRAYGDNKNSDITAILQDPEEVVSSPCGDSPGAPTNNDGYIPSGTTPTWSSLLFIGEDLQNELDGYTIQCDSSNNYQAIGDDDPTLKCQDGNIVLTGCAKTCNAPTTGIENYSDELPATANFDSEGKHIPESDVTLPNCTSGTGQVELTCPNSDTTYTVGDCDITVSLDGIEGEVCYDDDYCNHLGFKGSWAGMFTDYKTTYISNHSPRYYKHKEDSSDDKCSLPKTDPTCTDYNDEPEWTDETGDIYTDCCESRKIWEDDDCSKLLEQYNDSSYVNPTTWGIIGSWNFSKCKDDGTSDYSTS